MRLSGRGRILLAALALVAPPDARMARADESPRLTLEGRPVELSKALTRDSDGTVWITRADLERHLGAHVKRLIPRPIDPERRRQRARRSAWVLCGQARCATYRGRADGDGADASFDLTAAAKALGYRVRRREATYDLSPPAAPESAERLSRVRLGGRVPDLSLPILGGSSRRFSEERGKRLLILTWASWSPTRDRLADWHAAAALRANRDLAVWSVALDVEGEKHVRRYAPAGATVGVDRDADLARLFRLDDVGRWFLLDELGILRAEGETFGPVDLIWLDQHLREEVLEVEPPANAPGRPVGLDVLRERVAAEPDSTTARVALSDALGNEHREEAEANARALAKLRPQSMPFAFRLARTLLDAGRTADAERALDEARRRMPRMWTLRKQYWALTNPERFHGGEIDLAWQKEQRKEERAWLDPPGYRSRGKRK